MPEFTKNQQLAIDERGCNILVSAAAGSGKTSVLTERIIRRVTSEEDPVDVDRLLVMTFTNAAAAEMRNRIREGLAGSQKQSLLVNNAMITTIHGFCKSVITDHFEKIGLDPNFRVADENECRLIRQDALDDTLEAAYEAADPAFLRAVECFSAGKNDNALSELVLPIYDFIRADPEPEKFMEKCCEAYEFESFEKFADSPLIRGLEAFMADELEKIMQMADKALEIIDENEGIEPYRAAIEAYKNGLTIDTPSFDEVRKTLRSLDIPAFGKIADKNLDETELEAKNAVKTIRDDIKERLSKLSEYLVFDLKTTYEHMLEAKVELKALADLVIAFAKAYDEAKRDKNVIDFSDMEHMAIAILRDPEIAKDYREHFEEIYIDEYQDSNMAQETLVRLICRKDPGNVFQVGDVKQSIYRFRQARPDLFLEKYNTYTDDPGPDRRILLNDNFRSRREVTDAVNEVFSAIMHKELGGIEYDKDAALSYAATCYSEDAPCEGDNYRAEIIIGQKEELSSDEMAADIIAQRIRSMIDSGYKVYDKVAKITRPASYGDFMILVRSIKKPEPVFRKVFASCGIPLAVTGREGYFDTPEIKTVLAFLSAVDNTSCDIPLAAVAKCPVGGFSDKELAQLTAAFGKKMCLYERIKAGAGDTGAELKGEETEKKDEAQEIKTEISEDVKNKCRALLDLLEEYKVMSTYTPVHTLITTFIDREYGDHVKCMSNAAQRMANLQMLLAKAEDFGRTSFKGLYQFVRYMDQIRKYSIDDGEASMTGENDDVVRIMTMHSSKGLEFPVVFLAGIEKRRNTQDEGGKILWSTSAGFGCDHTDLKRRTVSPTLPKIMVKQINREESIAEEMRILYVAMTRAREKLIMVGCDKEDTFENVTKDIDSCLSYLDMIKVAHGGKGFKNIDISNVTEAGLVAARFEETMEEESAADEIFKILRSNESEDTAIPDCLKNAAFIYPYPINPDLKAKYSVSELKHRAIEEEIARGEELVPDGEQLFGETDPETYIPKFMREEGETASGGTFYGTAFHRIMELWDYPADKDTVKEEDVTAFAAKMHERRRMDKDQVDAIRPGDVAKFLNSELAQRMKKAKATDRLFREQPFVIGVPKDGETVLVQGIIDVYFVEDDGITIVDYKTDSHVSEEMLINRYRAQLEYYGTALGQITGKNIKALVIYSTSLGRQIIIPEKTD